MSSPTSPAPTASYPLSHRQILLVIVGLMTGTLLGALDQTIVATALPTIVGDLGSVDQLAWVVTAYLLASTVSTAIYGPVSDIYGRRRVYLFAISLFLVGSVLSGLAQSMPQLIGARTVQGLGAGGLMTLAFAIIGDVIPPRERGRYTGYFGAVFGVASIAGPLVGGFIVDQWNWRWIFLVNIPLGAVALVVTNRLLKGVPHTRRDHRLDLLGAALLAGWATTLLLVLERGRSLGWTSPAIIGLTIVGLGLFVWFVFHELRSEEPIVPIRIFRNRVVVVALACAFVAGLSLFAGIIYLPVYLQIVKGLTPTTSGLAMFPLVGGLLIGSIGSGRLITRWGRYKIFPVVGFALAAVGVFMLSRLTVDTSNGTRSLAMLILGVGFGLTTQVLVLAAQNAVERRDMGVATSTTTFMRSMGGTFGTAIFGTILASSLASGLASRFPEGLPAGINPDSVTGAPKVIRSLPPEILDKVLDAFVVAVHNLFLVALPIIVIGFVLSLFLKDVKLKGREDMVAEPGTVANGAEPSVAESGDAVLGAGADRK